MSDHKIYRATFSDGQIYVGRTSMTIAKRFSQHKQHGPLTERLAAEHPIIEVIDRAATTDDAILAEIRAIKAVPREQRLNTALASRSPGLTRVMSPDPWAHHRHRRRWPRTSRPTRCSACAGVYPPSWYHTDQRRSSGISSRCKACRSLYASLAYRSGESSHAYALMRSHQRARSCALPDCGLCDRLHRWVRNIGLPRPLIEPWWWPPPLAGQT